MISAAIYTGVMRLNVHGSPGWKWLVEVMEPRLCKQNSIKISYKFSLVLCSVLKSRSDLRWETLKQERVNCILKELCILGCITKPVPSGIHCSVFCWQMNMTCSIMTLHLLPPISVQDCRDENFSVNMLSTWQSMLQLQLSPVNKKYKEHNHGSHFLHIVIWCLSSESCGHCFNVSCQGVNLRLTGVTRSNVRGSPGWKWSDEVMEPRLSSKRAGVPPSPWLRSDWICCSTTLASSRVCTQTSQSELKPPINNNDTHVCTQTSQTEWSETTDTQQWRTSEQQAVNSGELHLHAAMYPLAAYSKASLTEQQKL